MNEHLQLTKNKNQYSRAVSESSLHHRFEEWNYPSTKKEPPVLFAWRMHSSSARVTQAALFKEEELFTEDLPPCCWFIYEYYTVN